MCYAERVFAVLSLTAFVFLKGRQKVDRHQAEGIAAITVIREFYGEVVCLRDRKVLKSRIPNDSAMNRKNKVSCEKSTTVDHFSCHDGLELQRAAA